MYVLGLEDAGWKKLCPKSAPIAAGLVAVCKKAGYTLVESEGDFLVEPREFKDLYALHTTYSRRNFESKKAEFDLGRLPVIPKQELWSSVEDPDSFIERFLQGPDDSMQALRSLRGLVTLTDIPSFPTMMARRVIPAFLEKYAEGRVHIIAISELLSHLHAHIRVLSPFEIFESEEIKPLGATVARMMAEAHATHGEDFGVNALETVLHFMFPNCYGFLCPRLNCEVVFQLPKPVESLGRFPREILDFARWGSVFDQKTPTKELLNYIAGKPHDRASLLSRWVCPKVFVPDEIAALIHWTIERVNYLYSYLFDLTAHVSLQTGYVSPLLLRKRHMTIERLLIETTLIASDRDSYVRKTLFFNLHDKFASLMAKEGDQQERQKVFNRLLKKSHYTKRLSKIFQTIPEPFLTLVRDVGQQLYDQIFQAVIDDIWLTSRKKKGIVLGRQEGPSSTSYGPTRFVDEQVDEESFVARYLHAARNTLHSYFLAHSGFERYMSLSKGPVPDVLPELAWLFMFMMLEDPIGLVHAQWKQP
jgi:hypothetical protein